MPYVLTVHTDAKQPVIVAFTSSARAVLTHDENKYSGWIANALHGHARADPSTLRVWHVHVVSFTTIGTDPMLLLETPLTYEKTWDEVRLDAKEEQIPQAPWAIMTFKNVTADDRKRYENLTQWRFLDPDSWKVPPNATLWPTSGFVIDPTLYALEKFLTYHKFSTVYELQQEWSENTQNGQAARRLAAVQFLLGKSPDAKDSHTAELKADEKSARERRFDDYRLVRLPEVFTTVVAKLNEGGISNWLKIDAKEWGELTIMGQEALYEHRNLVFGNMSEAELSYERGVDLLGCLKENTHAQLITNMMRMYTPAQLRAMLGAGMADDVKERLSKLSHLQLCRLRHSGGNLPPVEDETEIKLLVEGAIGLDHPLSELYDSQLRQMKCVIDPLTHTPVTERELREHRIQRVWFTGLSPGTYELACYHVKALHDHLLSQGPRDPVCNKPFTQLQLNVIQEAYLHLGHSDTGRMLRALPGTGNCRSIRRIK